MEILLISALCFAIGYFVGTYRTAKLFRDILEGAVELENLSKQAKLSKEDVPVMRVETHGDILYMFTKETDEFMCQGKTLQELNSKLSELRDIHIALVEYGKRGLLFVNGEIVEGPYEG